MECRQATSIPSSWRLSHHQSVIYIRIDQLCVDRTILVQDIRQLDERLALKHHFHFFKSQPIFVWRIQMLKFKWFVRCCSFEYIYIKGIWEQGGLIRISFELHCGRVCIYKLQTGSSAEQLCVCALSCGNKQHLCLKRVPPATYKIQKTDRLVRTTITTGEIQSWAMFLINLQ